MSTNDPHLEAQMELESRSPQHREPPPPAFARRQAWVLGAGLVALMIAFRAFSVPLFWAMLAVLPAIGVALIMNRRDPKPPKDTNDDRGGV